MGKWGRCMIFGVEVAGAGVDRSCYIRSYGYFRPFQ